MHLDKFGLNIGNSWYNQFMESLDGHHAKMSALKDSKTREMTWGVEVKKIMIEILDNTWTAENARSKLMSFTSTGPSENLSDYLQRWKMSLAVSNITDDAET